MHMYFAFATRPYTAHLIQCTRSLYSTPLYWDQIVLKWNLTLHVCLSSWGICHKGVVRAMLSRGTKSNHLQHCKWIFWLVTAPQQRPARWNHDRSWWNAGWPRHESSSGQALFPLMFLALTAVVDCVGNSIKSLMFMLICSSSLWFD